MKAWGLGVVLVSALVVVYWFFGRDLFAPPPLTFDMVLGQPAATDPSAQHPTLARHIAWNTEGTRVIARQDDGTVTGWDTRTGQGTAIARTQAVFAYCPAGDQLVVNIQGAAVLLSLSSGAFTRLSEARHDHAAFSADCSALALAREDEATVRLWRPDAPWQSVETAQPVRNSLMLSRDGRVLAAAGGTYSEASGHRTALELFRLGPDGATRTLQVADTDEILGMWSMAFSPDGAGLMLGSQVLGQAGLRHIETATGKVRWGHDGFASHWVRALAVSPDGIVLATGDEQGYLRLWDVDTGTKVGEYRSEMVIQSLAFSRDGKKLAVGLWDGTIGIASVRGLLRL